MARTSLTLKQLAGAVWNRLRLGLLQAKLAEHDTAIDALEGGTTSSVVTIHPVRAASTANVANLAACSTTMDTSVTLVAGDRVLLKDQSTVEQNGIHIVGTVANGAAPLTRATDWDEAAEIKANTMVAVKEGTANATTIWQLTGDFPTVVGTSHQHFTQVYNATQATAAGITIAKRSQRIQHSDLTDAVNGEAQAVNIGAVLPANAIVLASEVNIATLFSGGSASAVKLDVGGTTATAITNQADVFTGAATGKLSLATGTHVRGNFGGEQLKATFTPDGGHTLDGLSAGDLTVTVWYSVLA